MPFAQFGVDPDTVFTVLDELTIPADQLKAFQENKDGCVIGRKLADDKKLKVGDQAAAEGGRLPGRPGPDGPRASTTGRRNRDLRMCLVRFDYFDELLKRVAIRARRSTSTRRARGYRATRA